MGDCGVGVGSCGVVEKNVKRVEVWKIIIQIIYSIIQLAS